MAKLTLGDLDPNRNFGDKDILGAISAVAAFENQGGALRAQQVGISLGDALQRFSYAVLANASPYDRSFDFKIESIDSPCLTKKGAKQSPALATFCRHSGILDDVDGQFRLSKLGRAVFSKILTPQEYVFVLLSKQGVYVDNVYKDKFLVCIAPYFLSGKTIPENHDAARPLINGIIAQYCAVDQFDNEARVDLLLNAMRMAGLLRLKSGANDLELSADGAEILKDIYEHRTEFEPTPVSLNEKYAYMCDPQKGILEIVDTSNAQIYLKTYPGLMKLAGAHLQQGEECCRGLLRVGDHFVGKDGGEFTVVEVLPRVYRIRVDENGKIRTVPRTVVKSWQDFYLTHPTVDYDLKKSGGGIEHKTNVPIRDAATRPIRDLINETTIDDKYEHGYDGMLGTIARWLLDNPREEIPDSEQPKLHELLQESSNVDRLTIALKLFREARKSTTSTDVRELRDSSGMGEAADADTTDWGCQEVRDWFAEFTPEKLKENFAYFRSRMLWSKRVQGTIGREYAHIDELGAIMQELKDSPRPIGYYASKEFSEKCPDGFGKSTATDFLMKFHPNEYISFTGSMMDALDFLGLWPKDVKRDMEVCYNELIGAATRVRNRMNDIDIGRLAEGKNPEADYLTVNEFLWWTNLNKDLIKEKVMEKKMKNDKPTERTEERKKLAFNSESKDDELLLRLLASLRAKPFAILAGHSGTGKSRYVKKLAYMTCNKNELHVEGKLPGNYLLLQVKPNWHDSTDLLGFRNAMDKGLYQKTALIEFLFRAYHFNDTPFFLCLDEMNLAPVEQYFAEFLSAMESKEPVPLNDISAAEPNLYELGCEWTDAMEYVRKNGFSIPKNLFIVGTVNMDETTNQFSRKVLDRAFTIEMTDVDFTKFGSVKEPSYEDTIPKTEIDALLNGDFAALKLDDEDTKEDSSLVKVQKVLEPTAFAIAYRFASEYTLLKRALDVFNPDKNMKLDALDQAVLMKILPRIAGEADYIRKIYGEKDDEGLRKALAGKTKSLEKIKVILDRAKATDAQYISFWP